MKQFLSLITFFLVNISYAQDCTFGFLLPLSGEYASGGQDCQMGMEIAKENKKSADLNIKYVMGDSRAIGKVAISEFKKMASVDKVDAVLLVKSVVGMPVNPISKAKKVPILGVVGHTDFIDQNPYAFRFWPSVKLEAVALADFANKNNHKKIAILTTEDDWFLSFAESFKARNKEHGGEIVYEDTLTPDYIEYKSIISKISASKPDAVFLNTGVTHLSTFIKQARESGLTQKFYATFWVKTKDVVGSNTADTMDGIAFVEVNSELKNFTDNFKKKFTNTEPNAMHYTCYTGMESLIDACEKAKDTSKDVYTALSSQGSFSTLDGDVKVIDRETQYDVVVREFEGKDVS